MIGLLLAGLALAARAAPEREADEFPDVVEVLADGVRVDWTEMRLDAEASSDKTVGAWHDRRLQEQDALDRLAPRLEAAARRLCVTPETSAGTLLDAGDELAHHLREGLAAWRVEETVYHSSGRVELHARLDIATWLRPAGGALAGAEGGAEPPAGAATGLVVDARGLPVRPCFAPTILAPDGTVVYDAGHVGAEAAQRRVPALFVLDPADPRAWRRAGPEPLFARAVSTRAGAIVLDPRSAAHIAGRADGAVAAARVVVVVDPPGNR